MVFAYIPSANAAGSAASGIMATVKAYPCGRWYATKKKATESEVVDSITKASEKKMAATQASGGQATQANANAETSKSEAAQSLNGYLEQGELYPLIGETWHNRISFFYGRSMGNFDTPIINGAVNAIGIEFDVAPEFAVMFGAAFFQPAGTSETRRYGIFGVQMNFNCIRGIQEFGELILERAEHYEMSNDTVSSYCCVSRAAPASSPSRDGEGRGISHRAV